MTRIFFRIIISLSIVILILVGMLALFLLPEYVELGIMTIIGSVILITFWLVLPRIRRHRFIISQTRVVFFYSGFCRFLFAGPIAYFITYQYSDGLPTWLTIILIAMIPVMKPLLETILDKMLRNAKLRNLEEETGKLALDTSELHKHSKSTALADSLFTMFIMGIALTKLFPDLDIPYMDINPVEQTMMITLLVTLLCPVAFHLHKDQRELREFLSSVYESKKTGTSPTK